MAKFTETLREHLRITILRLLDEQADCSLNESLLVDGTTGWGFNPSRDRMRTELAWLQEQDLVEVEDMDGFMIATLTQRGSDVVNRRVVVPGVKRPTPKR